MIRHDSTIFKVELHFEIIYKAKKVKIGPWGVAQKRESVKMITMYNTELLFIFPVLTSLKKFCDIMPSLHIKRLQTRRVTFSRKF